MNDLKKIYQRLQANYPEGDWEIALEGERLSIRLERAQVVVEGGRAVFTEEEEPAQELQDVSDDDLYEAIETFLLYQQEDGDEFLSSEEVREACNATYRAAAKGLRRRGRLVLILTTAAEFLLLLSRTYLEAGLWVLIPFFLFPVLAWAVLGILKKRTLDRLWVCPQCGKSLPISGNRFSPKPAYTTQCPHCGHPLEDPATLETEGEEEDPLEGLPLPQPASKWPSRVYGILALAYCLLALWGVLAGWAEATGLGVALALLLLVPVLVLGLALLLCNGPELPEFPQPQLAVRESWIPLVLGLCLLPLGLAFMIPALGGPLDPVLDLPFALFLALVGLLLVLTGAWALLARRNRTLYAFRDGSMLYISSWGRRREITPGQAASLRLGANGSLAFLDQEGKKLLSVEGNMEGSLLLAVWAEEQGIRQELTPLLEKQVERENPAPQWREEYSTWWHRHLGAVRAGVAVTVVLFLAGCVLPFALYILDLLKFRQAVYLSAFAPLPFLALYLACAPVIALDTKPPKATAEWKTHHVRAPSLVLLVAGLLLASQFFYFWNELVMQTVDEIPFLVLWGVLSVALGAAVFLRTPKRLRGDGVFLLALFCLIEGYALAYGGNLALCGPARHYPAQVLDRFQQEDDGDTEYYLELLLDDGTQAQVQVSETVYRLEAEGTEFVVCQLESPLGIRMVDLHLPEAVE